MPDTKEGEKPFCCPNCRRPWDVTSAATLRMQRIVDGECGLQDAIEEPGFVADLRLVVTALSRALQQDTSNDR